MRFVEEQAPTGEAAASSRARPLAYQRTADPGIGIGTPFYGQGHDASWPDNPTSALAARPLPGPTAGFRVAIVHEWLDTYAGSERVLEQLLLCFPSADVFTVVDFMDEAERGFLQGRKVQTSFVQRLPFARRCFRHYLGLMPIAIQQLNLSGYDLVISSSHAVAKGVITGPDQLHVSYVHSPMRYVWDLQHQY